MRLLIRLHRYLGIGLGWLVALWCLSGIVMIYVPYPSLDGGERVAALAPLTLERCCAAGPDWLADLPVDDVSVLMQAGRPVLALGPGSGTRIDLETGAPVDGIDAAGSGAIVAALAGGTPASVRYLGELDVDQWTLETWRPGQRLHRVAAGDPAGTEWYVDAADGSLVQVTTATERRWNYLGSVLHWLYFTPLRRLGAPWAELVIWTSVTALVLTLFGLTIGIAKARWRGELSLSPYRGLARWHHILGLAFGIVTLTWLTSGLLSMNPWGLLLGNGPLGETGRLEGQPPDDYTVATLLATLGGRELPPGTTMLDSAPLAGEPYLIAELADGRRQRLSGRTLAPAPLSTAELAGAAARLRPDAHIVNAGLIDTPDAYYYDDGGERPWPVYRVELDDTERTLYYLDPVTGRILDRIDGTRAAYRWLFTALHRLDFAPIVRIRPLRDVLMIVLLAGAAAGSLAGLWLGVRSLGRRRPA